ncbi:MAG: hypothetical protein K2H09_02360 [Treponemataceae bacterium]|nr:hypothetical protein [Treponemataceae bacterium]
MPTAIIFHPAQERTLADEQRRILRELNAQEALFFPLYPLYCFLDGGGLAEIPPEACRMRIKSLAVHPARLDGGRLVFPVEILLDGGGRAEGSVPAGRRNERKAAAGPPTGRIFPSEALPLNCRVFQAADVSTDGVLWEVSRAVWVKTRDA